MYSTLQTLKSYILPRSLRGQDEWDTMLQAIGKGVADQFDRHCNRKFRREENATVEFGGEHMSYVLPHYPIESVSLVETREDPASAWEEYSDAIEQQSNSSGLIQFYSRLVSECDRVRVTYTGGYFIDTTGSTEQPAGSIALPDDVVLAWFEQCAHIFEKKDKLGANFVALDRKLGGALLPVLQTGLTNAVKEMLQGHKRYQII